MKIKKIIPAMMLPVICLLPLSSACAADASSAFWGDHTAVTVGIAARNSPRYTGSSQRQNSVLPIVQIQRGALYVDSTRGIGWQWQSPAGFYLDHSIGYDPGRADKNNNWRPGANRLRGMGSINGAVTTTLIAGYQFAPWLAAEVSGEFALSERERGNQYRAGLKSTVWQSVSTDDTVSLSADALFGDSRFTNIYYGVTEQQHARSGLAAYHTGRGVYGYALGINWGHQFTPHWATNVSLSSLWLNNNVAKSPVVEKRSNTEANVAVLYSF